MCPMGTTSGAVSGSLGSMKRKARSAAKRRNRLWGIYHSDRDYARQLGNPIRTVVRAPSKIVAEEEAARRGFGDGLARPITPKQARQAQWLPQPRRSKCQ